MTPFNLELINHTWKVTFRFSPDNVEAIRLVPGRRFCPKDKAWYVPDSVSSRAFIKYYLGKDLSHNDYNLPVPIRDEMPYEYQKPYEHQKKAIEQMVSCVNEGQGIGIFAETGTGKTKMVLETVRRFPDQRFLVIAPAPLLKVWEDQAKKHKVSVLIYHGVNRIKYSRTLSHAFLIVTSYQTFVNDVNFWNNFTFKAVFCDESHLLKIGQAQRTKAIKNYSGSKCKILLSGTPYGNKLEDVYSQINIANPKSYGPRRVFHDSFCVFGGWENKEIIGYKNLEIFYEILKRSSLVFRKADCLDLPEKTFQRIELKMGINQGKAYRRAQAGGVKDLPISSVLTKISKLRQISSGFIYVPNPQNPNENIYEEFENPKLEYFSSIPWSEPTIIWCNFIREQKQIADFLEKEKIRYSCVTSPSTTLEKVNEFEMGKTDVIIANLASMQYGFTLNRATRVIYYSPSFSQLQRSQSEDRCHRIGQTHKVCYVDLIVSPVEEWILKAQEEKIETKNYILKKLVDNESK